MWHIITVQMSDIQMMDPSENVSMKINLAKKILSLHQFIMDLRCILVYAGCHIGSTMALKGVTSDFIPSH